MQTGFTIDGTNLNNNIGLTNAFPGGGNPISLDAIEEMQVSVAPYDVRQSNFIGGVINAITESGTNPKNGTSSTPTGNTARTKTGGSPGRLSSGKNSAPRRPAENKNTVPGQDKPFAPIIHVRDRTVTAPRRL